MHRHARTSVALLLAGFALAACAEAPRFPSRAEPLVVAEPANLTGRPLRVLDRAFYTADSIPLTDRLGASGGKIDFVATLGLALERQLAEAGFMVDGSPPPADARWRLYPAILDWDASRLSRDGELTVRTSLFAVAPNGKAIECGPIEVTYALLDANPLSGIAGAGRSLADRHEGLAWLLAGRLIALLTE